MECNIQWHERGTVEHGPDIIWKSSSNMYYRPEKSEIDASITGRVRVPPELPYLGSSGEAGGPQKCRGGVQK